MEDVYIPPDSRQTLIQLSRRTLESFVRGIQRQADGMNDFHLLASEYGAFVSLHKGEELRGCIGTCFPTHPLFETVIEMTEAAASRDGRVSPIYARELGEIHIEISVLSPLAAAPDPLSLEAGRHGLHVASGESRAVFLPQVATRYDWDIETLLCQLCLKAGLPESAWRQPETRISSFTALIIGEDR